MGDSGCLQPGAVPVTWSRELEGGNLGAWRGLSSVKGWQWQIQSKWGRGVKFKAIQAM